MDLTAIIAIIIVIGGPIAIAIIAIISENKSRQKKYEAMIKAVEMGKSPEDVKRMFDEGNDKNDKPYNYNGQGINSRLRRGIILIAVALDLVATALIIRNSLLSAFPKDSAFIFLRIRKDRGCLSHVTAGVDVDS